VPFSPNACRSDEDEACDPDAEEMISSKEGDIGERARRRSRGAGFGGCVVEKDQSEGVGGQQW
jgi:hypothetical protein